MPELQFKAITLKNMKEAYPAKLIELINQLEFTYTYLNPELGECLLFDEGTPLDIARSLQNSVDLLVATIDLLPVAVCLHVDDDILHMGGPDWGTTEILRDALVLELGKRNLAKGKCIPCIPQHMNPNNTTH